MTKGKGVKIWGIALVLLTAASFMLYAGGGAQPSGASSGPVEVTFWDMPLGNDTYAPAAEKLLATIGKDHPNIKVKYQSIPWVSLREVFATAVAAKQAPDISTGSGFQSFQYAGANEILDVGSIIEEWRADGTLEHYPADYVEYFKFNGVQVGIPRNFEPRYIIYRADWFERDGITPPKNWNEFYAAATHFTDASKGTYGVVFPAANSPGNVMGNMWWAMNGSGYWTPDGRNPDFTNSKNVEAWEFVRRLRDAKAIPEGVSSYEVNEVTQLAAQNAVAMALVTGGAQGADIDRAVPGKFKILPPPAGPSANGRNGYVAAVNSIMGYKQTKHPEETKQVIKWWQEHIIEIWNSTAINGLPIRTDWVSDPNFIKNLPDPFMADFIKYCMPSTHRLVFPATNLVPEGWLTQNLIDGERWTNPIAQAVLTDNRRSVLDILQETQDKAIQAMRDFRQ